MPAAKLVFAYDVESVHNAGEVLERMGENGGQLQLRFVPRRGFERKKKNTTNGMGEKLTPRMVRTMLISRSDPHPHSKKTPSGGRITARMILQMSLAGGRTC